jgi:hypothetical protein
VRKFEEPRECPMTPLLRWKAASTAAKLEVRAASAKREHLTAQVGAQVMGSATLTPEQRAWRHAE